MPQEQPGEPLDWHYEDNDQELAHVAFVDPRLRQMGTRVLCAPQSFNLAGFDEDDDNSLNASDDLTGYNLLKLLLGVTDGPTLTNKSPFQFNFDKTNSLSLNKRHYVGKKAIEELYYRPRSFQIWPAMVSKEPLGVRFPIDFVDRDYKFDTADRSIYNDDMNPVGQVSYYMYNAMQVQIRPEHLDENLYLYDRSRVQLWKPSWLRDSSPS